MIRWSYLVPRLTLIACLVLFLSYGLSPLAREVLVRSVQSRTGARVDVGQVNVSLWNTRLDIGQLQVADPRELNQNVVEAQELLLDVDRNALLKKRLVVREGRISGLRFNTDRIDSGELNPRNPNEVSNFAADKVERWFKSLADRVNGNLSDYSVTARECERVRREWPPRYEQLEDRLAFLKKRILDLQEQTRTLAGRNPLRHLEDYHQALADFEQVRGQLAQVPAELQHLQNLAFQDRDAINAAKARDIQRIRGLLTTEPLDPNDVSAFLLDGEQDRRVQQALAWIHWVRENLPSKREPFEPERGRGATFEFGRGVAPSFLIHRLAVDGTARFDGTTIPFAGHLSDLTEQPALHGKPTIIELSSSGTTPLRLLASLDRTQSVPYDRLLLECPSLAQPQQVLGNTRTAAVAVAPGQARCQIFATMNGQQIQGRIVVVRDELQLNAMVSDSLGGVPLASRLTEALRPVQRMELTVNLSGTIDDPHWQMQSPFGHAVKTAIQGAFQQELTVRTEQQVAQVSAYADRQVAQLHQLVDVKTQQLSARISTEYAAVANLADDFSRRLQIPNPLRSAELGLENLLK